MSDPTSSQNHAIAWLAMYVWWDGSSDTKARLTMTAHEEHGFPDPTFESIFCGSSFDPSLKADTTPTFLCNFLLGVFRDRRRWKHEESPASFGTVWPSSLPSARVCVTGPLQDACIAASNKGHDSVRSRHFSEQLTTFRNTQGGTSQWWPMYKTCAWGFGVGPRPASPGTKAHSD